MRRKMNYLRNYSSALIPRLNLLKHRTEHVNGASTLAVSIIPKKISFIKSRDLIHLSGISHS